MISRPAKRALVLPAVLARAACAQQIAESRVRSALLDGGVDARTAECMAGRMTERLTTSQLRRLQELERPAASERRNSLADYLDRLRRVGDSEVIAVTASSAALCRTRLAD